MAGTLEVVLSNTQLGHSCIHACIHIVAHASAVAQHCEYKLTIQSVLQEPVPGTRGVRYLIGY